MGEGKRTKRTNPGRFAGRVLELWFESLNRVGDNMNVRNISHTSHCVVSSGSRNQRELWATGLWPKSVWQNAATRQVCMEPHDLCSSAPVPNPLSASSQTGKRKVQVQNTADLRTRGWLF